LVPEVIQTSAMDCGPAALTALLRGHGAMIEYGRVREACQTAVDGTSIDALEDLAVALGFRAQQVMLPVEQLVDPLFNVLPAIVVIRLPNGWPHFVVVWKRHGPWLQVMDPAVGRRFWPVNRFLDNIYRHHLTIPATAWEEHLRSCSTRTQFQARLGRLGFSRANSQDILESVLARPGWQSLARFDSALRLCEAARALARWHRLRPHVQGFTNLVHDDGPPIPQHFQSARAPTAALEDAGVLLEGGIALSVHGLATEAVDNTTAQDSQPAARASIPVPEIAAILSAPTVDPLRVVVDLIRHQGMGRLIAAFGGMFLAGAAILLIGFLLDSAWQTGSDHHRGIMIGLVLLIALLAAVEWPARLIVRGVGRRLEGRLRWALAEKASRLHDRYMRSRPTSDVVSRAHLVHHIRTLPELSARIVRAGAALVASTLGLWWLVPTSAPLAITMALLAVTIPWITRGLVQEPDLRLRVHDGALSRVVIDGLMGNIPLRTHGGGPALWSEHETVLCGWADASRTVLSTRAFLDGISLAVTYSFVAVLLFAYLPARSPTALLFVFLALGVPTWGRAVALAVHDHPRLLNLVRRIAEPLGTADDPEWATASPGFAPVAGIENTGRPRSHDVNLEATSPPGLQNRFETEEGMHSASGVALCLTDITVRIGGQSVLHHVSLDLPAGAHLAVVGHSGSGKSTLIATILGFERPVTGSIQVDGAPLTGEVLHHLRACVAWVDPQVALWNRSLRENLLYGHVLPDDDVNPLLDDLVQRAHLSDLVTTLREGLDTPLGEMGTLVSGGEGQRVRLGRALNRREARLVLLDEPFVGLDRATRAELLDEVRRYWHHASLLYVTHEVGEALQFSRVVVLEGGCMIEDDIPSRLAEREDSYFAHLLKDGKAAPDVLRRNPWRRVRIDGGRPFSIDRFLT
jgi:ATP-binding cassette subfamily B protein